MFGSSMQSWLLQFTYVSLLLRCQSSTCIKLEKNDVSILHNVVSSLLPILACRLHKLQTHCINMNLASGYSAFLGCKLHNYIALYCKRYKTIYKGKRCFFFTHRGLPRGGGVKKTLYLWSNRWHLNLGPFGLQSNALTTWPQCTRNWCSSSHSQIS